MSAETKAVDVLEVLDDAISEFNDLRMTDRHGIGPALIDARAAVAEQIAAGQMVERDLAWARTEHTTALNALSDALARVQGGAK